MHNKPRLLLCILGVKLSLGSLPPWFPATVALKRRPAAMDRISKMTSTLSNLLKKVSDTEERITANLK